MADCLSNEYWSYKECGLCPVHYIEAAIDLFSGVMLGAIKMRNSPNGGTSAFSYLPESVDQEMCRARVFLYKRVLNILVEERVLGGRL